VFLPKEEQVEKEKRKSHPECNDYSFQPDWEWIVVIGIGEVQGGQGRGSSGRGECSIGMLLRGH
jgi:hypothetical protein